MKLDKIAEQAGQVVEEVVSLHLTSAYGRSRGRRGVLRPLVGLMVLAGGAAAVFYAQADEEEREQALTKLSELAEQLGAQVGATTG